MGWRSRALPAVLVFLAAATVSADQKWLELRTPNFVVVTNGGEGTARDVGWQFEQVRHVFLTLWPWARRQPGRPFVVLVVRSEGDLKALAPYYWEDGRDGTTGVAVTGADKDYVALQAGIALEDALGNNPYYYAYWGYALVVVDASFPVALPMWYRLGLADLFGNTIVRGKDVQVGRLLQHHLQRMAQGQRIPLAQVLSATRTSKVYADESWRPMFDAEAWMFTHFLLFGDKGAHRQPLDRFADLMRQGRKADEAFQQAFGDVAALDAGFRRYIDRQLFQFGQVQLDLNLKKEAFAARALSPAAAAAVRAGFHAAMRRPVEARALLAEARKTEPASVAAAEVEGLLLDREDKDAEALAAYARAAEAGSDNYYVHYRRAQLLRQEHPPKELQAQRARFLAEAVRLNPGHAWAHAELARTLSDVEPGERAVAAAKRAVELEPSVAAHRLALVDALWSATRVAEAKAQAAEALTLPLSAEDRQGVERWIAFLDRPQNPGVSDAAQGAATDSAAAGDWIPAATEACEHGNASACGALASALERGAGMAKDPARALALYLKACDASELRGCVAAARMKVTGQGAARDLEAGRALARKACNAGELTGCTTEAVALASSGKPGERDEARALLNKACEGGEKNACQLLASLPAGPKK